MKKNKVKVKNGGRKIARAALKVDIPWLAARQPMVTHIDQRSTDTMASAIAKSTTAVSPVTVAVATEINGISQSTALDPRA